MKSEDDVEQEKGIDDALRQVMVTGDAYGLGSGGSSSNSAADVLYVRQQGGTSSPGLTALGTGNRGFNGPMLQPGYRSPPSPQFSISSPSGL